MTYQYTQDRKYDKWATVADNFDILEDELESDSLEFDDVEIEEFDELEIL